MITSKSPKAVAVAALRVARRALPAYSHKNSPKTFTQYQLFACLVLKSFWRTDYRGVVAQLTDNPTLTSQTLGLEKVPHFTTLQKASRRLLTQRRAKRLLKTTIRMHHPRRKRVSVAAVDSTGLDCTTASAYFIRRRVRRDQPWKSVTYRHYAKLSLVCDAQEHFILAYKAGRGPRPDVDEFRPLLAETLQVVRLLRVVADAGYDSEANHAFARDEHQIRTAIPMWLRRPGVKPARGRYRRLMQLRFNVTLYRRRSQVETVVSMLKRRQGSHVRGHTYWSQCRDLHLMVLTHNLMILWITTVFYRATDVPLRRL